MEEIELRHERMAGDGIDLHVVVAGKGPPVILLHGFPKIGAPGCSRSRSWLPRAFQYWRQTRGDTIFQDVRRSETPID